MQYTPPWFQKSQGVLKTLILMILYIIKHIFLLSDSRKGQRATLQTVVVFHDHLIADEKPPRIQIYIITF